MIYSVIAASVLELVLSRHTDLVGSTGNPFKSKTV